MIALILTCCLATPIVQGVTPHGVVVEVSAVNDDMYCSVQANQYPVHRVMRTIAAKLGYQLTGLEDVEDSALVTVDLENRPVRDAVRYILGTAGMSGRVSADGIHVGLELSPFPDRDTVLQEAEIAFLTAIQRFPAGEQVPDARMNLAQIAIERGEREKAVRHYELLIEKFPGSPLFMEARTLAGRILVELEDWSAARPHFMDVGNNAQTDELIIEGRRELARCVLHLGESRRALFMLQALEQVYPAQEPMDHAQRLVLRARARIGLGDYIDALRDLDAARRLGPELVDEFESMDLRAKAMELGGSPVEAAVGWLAYSKDKPEHIQRQALKRAAELALSQEDQEVAVLFLHKHAVKNGVGDALEAAANEARARLGLEAESFSDGSASIQLHRAGQLIEAGLSAEAGRVFEALEPKVWSLGAAERVRFATGYGRILETEEGVIDAINLLRRVARTLESQANRTQLYLLAGEIYERHHRFEEAAAAYGGEL